MLKRLTYSFIFILLCLAFVNTAKAAGPTTINSSNISNYRTWTKAASPYIINSDVYVNFDLMIEPGTVVKFKVGGGLNLSKKVTAIGTKEDKIIFTSIKDDNFMGDTNNDGDATAPSVGNEWTAIYVYSGVFDNVGVYYGSYHNIVEGAISVLGSGVTVRNTEIKYSGYGGLLVYGATPVLENNVISNNAIGIIIWNPNGMLAKISSSTIADNSTGAYTMGPVYGEGNMKLDARNNWWGDKSGPYYKHQYYGKDNLSGKGNRIGGHVLKIVTEDLAGNKTEKTLSLNLVTDIDGVIFDVGKLISDQEIFKKNIGHILDQQLGQLKKRMNKDWQKDYIVAKAVSNQCNELLTKLDFYFEKKWISLRAYNILKEDVKYLLKY